MGQVDSDYEHVRSYVEGLQKSQAEDPQQSNRPISVVSSQLERNSGEISIGGPYVCPSLKKCSIVLLILIAEWVCQLVVQGFSA